MIRAELKIVWGDLAARLGLGKSGLGNEVWQQIVASYSEPQRYYHRLDHIAAVVHAFQDLKDRFADPDAALLALFFHDIVYDPARSDNEERSAGILQALLSGEVSDRACAHILATKRHEADSPDAALVVDIDMSVLAAPWPDYLTYAQGVAREYLPVYGVEAYAAGRVAVFLAPTLARGQIFLTPDFAGREDKARRNLREEMAQWTSGAFAQSLGPGL